MKRVLLALLTLCIATNVFATTYYYKGSGDLNVATNWNNARNGSGTDASTAPTTASSHVYIVQGTTDVNGAATGATVQTLTVSSTRTIAAGVTLEIEGGATLTASSALTFNGTAVFRLDNGATYNHSNTTAYSSTILAGIEDFRPSSNFVINSSNTTGPATPSTGFGNLTFSATASVNSSGALNDGASSTGKAIQGNLTVSGTSFRLTGSTALTMSIGGNLEIQTGGTLTLGNSTASPIVNVGGNFIMSGGTLDVLFTAAATGTINFNKAGTQLFTKTGGTITAATSSNRAISFVVLSGSVVDMGSSVLDALATSTINFTVNSGGGLITANANGISSGNTASGSIQNLAGARSFSTGANYTYNGSSAQITGTGLPSTVNNLTINNSAGVGLTNGVTVSNQLALTSGKVSLGANNLTMSGSSSSITGPAFGSASSSYIVTDGAGGLVIQSVGAGGRTGVVLFPVGSNATSYNPATIDNSTGTADDITVMVNSNNLGGVTANVSVKNTWTISDATPGGNNAIVALQWNAADENAAFDRTQSAIVRTNGATITNTPAYAAASGSGPYTKASETGITTFATGWGITSITTSPVITLNTAGFASNFGNVVAGGSSAEHTYVVSGTNLTANLVVTAPSDFKVSTTSGAGFGSSVTLTPASGTVSNTTIYVIYSPAAATGASGSLNITNASTGASTENVAVSGNAIAAEPTTTGSISFGTTTGASIVVNLPAVGNGSKRIIVVKQGAAVTYTPTDGAAPAGVNADFTAATDQGTGNKIVYDGTGSGSSVVTVTGLSAFTTYHFAVFEYNAGTGTSQNYYTASFVTGNQTTADGSVATDYYRSVVTGNWNAATTWESSHDNTTWMPATLTPDNNANAIVIRNGTIVTATADVTADQLTIEATGRLNINAAVTFTVADGTGTDMTINGYIKNSGTVTATGTVSATAAATYEHNVNNVNPPAITWSAGSTLKLSGTYTGAGTAPTGRLSAGSYQNIVITGDITTAGDYISLGDNAITVGGKLTISTTGSGAVLTSAGGTSPTVAEYEQTSGIVFINRNSGSTRSLTVTGNATISGGTLHIKTLAGTGAGELNIGGNLLASGGTITNSATAGSTVLRLNGTGAQTATFGTVSGTINYVINNSAGVTLGSDLTANGTFTFTAGNLTTGSNKLIIASTGSIVGGGTGWVAGNLQKNIATGATSKTFEVGAADAYRPVTIAFGNVTGAGDLVVSVSQAAGDHPNIATSSIDAAKSVNRYWTLTNSGVVFDNYAATFTFIAGDVDAGANTANFILRMYNGSAWSATTAGTLSATSAQATGVTAFGEFAIGESASSPAPTVSTQPSNASICAGSNTSFTSASTSLPTPTVQWERSIDGIAWTPITGTLDGSIYSGFATGTLTLTAAGSSVNGYQYRAVFTNGNGSATSTPATLTIKPIPSVTSSAAATICSGTAQNYTITSNVGGSTYSWSRAAVAGISNTAVSAQTSNPIIESLTNTTSAQVSVTYAITPTANGCVGSVFNYVVTVDPSSVGGSVASDQTICIGNTPASITLSGQTGTVIKWQSSTASNFVGAADVASSVGLTTLTGAAMGAITQNTYFRAVLQSGVCSQAFSNPVLITANSTITNATALAGTAGGAQVCASYDVAASSNYMNNCNLVATVTPSGGSAISGVINACVTVESSVLTAPNGQPYVARHFDILPATNRTTATSTMTLYFNQAEFTAYNTSRGIYPALPTGSGDAAGIANLRVTLFNTNGVGSSFTTYPAASGSVITPTSVTYNATADRWSVTFSATGSGALYVHTGNFPLPVTLVNFKGEQAGEINKLSWSTSTEVNNKGFELERSADGRTYTTITFIATKAENGNSTSLLDYAFNDRSVAGKTYYRLKQVDKDGRYNYSNVVVLNRKVSEVVLSAVYPNPTTKELNLKITSPKAEQLTIIVTDLTGKVVMRRSASVVTGDNQEQLNVSELAAGSYFIKAVCANGCETGVQKFVKQ
jgi:hypothetical protein